VAQRKLVMLDSAVKLGDLAASPGNRWKSYRATGPDNKVSGSMTSGGSVLRGKMTGHMRLKLWIIIKE
jgi:hypothetical protein